MILRKKIELLPVIDIYIYILIEDKQQDIDSLARVLSTKDKNTTHVRVEFTFLERTKVDIFEMRKKMESPRDRYIYLDRGQRTRHTSS